MEQRFMQTYAPMPISYPSHELEPNYPGIYFNSRDKMLEIDMYIEQFRVHPPYKGLAEYLHHYYPKALLRISLWDWRRDEVRQDPIQLDPKIVQDLRKNFMLLCQHISKWCEVRFDLPFLAAVSYQSPNDTSGIGLPKSLRKLEVREMSSVNAQLVNSLHSFLDQLWRDMDFMPYPNLRIMETAEPEFDTRMFPGLRYRKLSELCLDTICSAAQVVDLLSLCPTLRKAVFNELVGPKPRGHTTPITCTYLRHLTLENDNISFDQGENNPYIGMIWEVLRKINAPALNELSLGYEDIWSTSVFDRFIGNSKCGLEKLRLVGIKMSDKDLYRALAKNQHLRELTVQGQSAHGEYYDLMFPMDLLERMTHNGDWNCLCPHLQRLEVAYPSIQRSDSFRRMLQCRSPLRLRFINLISTRDIDPADFQALEELAKKGLSVYFDGSPAQFPVRRFQSNWSHYMPR